MSKLTRDNLQEFCRTCLSSLQRHESRGLSAPASVKVEEELWDAVLTSSTTAATTTTTTTTEFTLSYNIHLMPNLRKLLVLFTSLDVSEEDDADAYPKRLCQFCYDKMIDFQQFRNLALHSAEVLYDIVSSAMVDNVEGQSSKQSVASERTEMGRERVIVNESSSQGDTVVSATAAGFELNEDNEDPLLLPELTPPLENSIKTEPIDIDEAKLQVMLPLSSAYGQAEHNQLGDVKIEIDSEYEEDNSTFYENNALGTTYDSIGDDADDEEYALRNGAANSSSAALNAATTSPSGRQRLTGTPYRKRDRNKKSLKCPRCDKQVYKQVYLDAHIRGVHEGHQKPFLCLECQKAFTRYNQLHVHIQSNHLLDQKLICGFDGCRATFRLTNTLETHRKVVHISSSVPFSFGLQEVLELHQAQLNHEMEMDHICHQCYKKYSSKRALSEHLKRHAQIKKHVCKVCGVAKVTRTELQTHMRTHQPNLEKFKCTICPQEFNHKNAISRHVRVVHEGQRRFPCNFCPKRFATRNSQVCHERLHTGERPFSCEVCGKGFAQLEGLKSHMKNHDKNLRKHVCSFCSQRFITRKNLLDHEKRHQGDKPHICNTCNRGFFLPEDLLVHTKVHLEEHKKRSDAEDDGKTEVFDQDMGKDMEETEPEGDMMEYSSSQSSN